MLLDILNLCNLMLAIIFHLSVWLFWLISHSRLAALLVLTCIKFYWHSCSWWSRLEIVIQVLWYICHLLGELLRMNLWNHFSLALWSFSLHLLVRENYMWLLIRRLVVLINCHLIWNLHGSTRKVILAHLHIWWICIIRNSFLHVWYLFVFLRWDLVGTKYSKLWFWLNIC